MRADAFLVDLLSKKVEAWVEEGANEVRGEFDRSFLIMYNFELSSNSKHLLDVFYISFRDWVFRSVRILHVKYNGFRVSPKLLLLFCLFLHS